MPFTIRLGQQHDPLTLQVDPPWDHFPRNTTEIDFANLITQYAVVVEFPKELHATPRELHLRPGQLKQVKIKAEARGVYYCRTYITGPKCPTCGTRFPSRSGRFPRTVGTPDPPDEPIIIID